MISSLIRFTRASVSCRIKSAFVCAATEKRGEEDTRTHQHYGSYTHSSEERRTRILERAVCVGDGIHSGLQCLRAVGILQVLVALRRNQRGLRGRRAPVPKSCRGAIHTHTVNTYTTTEALMDTLGRHS